MLSTNLLPSEEKEAILYDDARRIAVFFACFAGAILSVASLLLVPTYIPLEFERRGLAGALGVAEEASRKLKVDETTRSVRAVQSSISSLKYGASSSVLASGILRLFLENQNVSITTLTVKKDGGFSLQGVAQTRRNLLDFEKGMRESGKFLDISSPLSNIVRETDVNFVLQGKLKASYGQ